MREGSEQPRWTISRGEPGPYRPRPTGWTSPGTVLRAELWEAPEWPFPTDAPGYRRIGERRVSAIVTTVREDAPVYCKDEDGDQPSDLIGEDGWLFVIHVRPATAEEAEDILADEAVASRRTMLEQRRRALFGRGVPGDGEVQPDGPVNLHGASQVPYGAELRHGVHYEPVDEIRVNAARGEAWGLYYNGGDGDDWSRNNFGSYIAVRYPLIPARVELIAELRAEYEIKTWEAEGVGAEAARVLILAGWEFSQAVSELGAFVLKSEEDARVALARPQEQWKAAGWETFRAREHERFTPADAALLADAGIRHGDALQLRRAGHKTVDQILNAKPPHIPDGVGRIVVAPEHPHSEFYKATVTSDPQFAREWLAPRMDRWNADRLEVVADVRPVHVTSEWSLWDDGALVVGEWMTEYHPAKRAAERLETLPEGAVQALNLVTSSRTEVDPDVWRLLLDATGHQVHEIASADHKGYQWRSNKVLRRYDFTTPSGVRSLWEAWGDEGGMSGGEGDYYERSEVYGDEAAARRSYADWKLS